MAEKLESKEVCNEGMQAIIVIWKKNYIKDYSIIMKMRSMRIENNF